MNKKSDLFIMMGLYGNSTPENVLNRAYVASTLDLVDKGEKAENIGRIIVSTNSNSIMEGLSGDSRVEIEKTEKDFHFENEFEKILIKYKPESLLYFSGGSGVLLDAGDIDSFSNLLIERKGAIIANNFYSSDFVGLNPADKILDIGIPNRDNMLGWKSRQAGYSPFELKRNAKTQYDLDSPLDLIPLSITAAAEGRLGEAIDCLSFEHNEIEQILPLLTDAQSSIKIAGRIGSTTWKYFEKCAACETNIVSEGRGLFASGKLDRSEQKFVTYGLLERMGYKNMLEYLLGDSDALFLDTRVLFAGKGIWPEKPDRFWSDLKKP